MCAPYRRTPARPSRRNVTDLKRKRAPRVLPVSQRSARGVSRSRIHQSANFGCYPSCAHLIRPSELPPAGELPFPAPMQNVLASVPLSVPDLPFGCPSDRSGPSPEVATHRNRVALRVSPIRIPADSAWSSPWCGNYGGRISAGQAVFFNPQGYPPTFSFVHKFVPVVHRASTGMSTDSSGPGVDVRPVERLTDER